MTPEPPALAGAAGRIPLARRRSRARRALVPFALLAVSAHLVGAAGLIEAPRIARFLFGAPPPPAAAGPPPEATIALIEQDTPTVGGSRPTDRKRPAAKPADTPEGKPPPRPIASPDSTDRVAAASGSQAGQPAPPKDAAPDATPAPPSQSAPEVNLDVDGDPGTGIVSGPNVVPASPEDSRINVPPAYPREAAMRREQGTVGLIVTIAPDGRPSAVDLASSSGYTALDDAARRAVSRWRFRPAIENGKPVQSIFNEQIEFTLEPHPLGGGGVVGP